MPDLILTCENCGNQYVFSEGEQAFYHNKGIPAPKLCPICRSIKAQERKIPPRPSAASSPSEASAKLGREGGPKPTKPTKNKDLTQKQR